MLDHQKSLLLQNNRKPAPGRAGLKRYEVNTQLDNKIPQSPPAVKPVAIYCRVSTEDQEREGSSLQTQREACLKYCQDKGYQAVSQFIETESGLTLDRPQLSKLRELVRTGQIKGVVIYCLDRLSRDPTHGVILQEELEKYHRGTVVVKVEERIEVGEVAPKRERKARGTTEGGDAHPFAPGSGPGEIAERQYKKEQKPKWEKDEVEAQDAVLVARLVNGWVSSR